VEATYTDTDLMIMFKFSDPALPCGGQINEHYDNFLELAATYNNINIVKHLTHRYNLRLKADCLSTIILYGHSDIIKYFVDRLGYSVHSIPNALRQSFYSRNTDMFKYILSKSDYDDGLLNLACISGYVEAVRILLADPRCDPNANDKEAYYSAIDYDYREIVNLFEMCPRFNRYIN
jgi:ankyrin repeat protein